MNDSVALDEQSISMRMSCYSRDVTRLNDLIDHLLSERTDLRQQIANVNPRLDTYKQQLADRQNSIQALEERTADLVNQTRTLIREREELREQLVGLLSDGHTQDLSREPDDELFDSFSQSYIKLSTENAALRDKLAEVDSGRDSLRQETVRQKGTITALGDEILVLQQTIADLNTSRQKLAGDIENTSKHMAGMKNQLLENAMLSQRQGERVATLQRDVKVLNEQRDSLQAELSSAEKEQQATVESLNTEIESLTQKIDSMTSEQAAMTARVNEATIRSQASIGARDKQIQSLTRQLDQLSIDQAQC